MTAALISGIEAAPDEKVAMAALLVLASVGFCTVVPVEVIFATIENGAVPVDECAVIVIVSL